MIDGEWLYKAEGKQETKGPTYLSIPCKSHRRSRLASSITFANFIDLGLELWSSLASEGLFFATAGDPTRCIFYLSSGVNELDCGCS